MIIHHYYIRNGGICDTIVWKHRRENRRKHQEKKEDGLFGIDTFAGRRGTGIVLLS